MATQFAPSRLGLMKEGTKHLQGLEWWLAQDQVRSYQEDIIGRLHGLPDYCQVNSYGTITYGDHSYDMKYVTIGDLSNGKPTVFLSAGVHGYEEGGVEGLMQFMEEHARDYLDHYNFVILPCVSPAAYEKDVRLNGNKENPNRHFYRGTKVQECALYINLIDRLGIRYIFSNDGHETTFTDPDIIRDENYGKKEKDAAVDADDIVPAAYIIEVCDDESQRIGVEVVGSLETIGQPVAQTPTVSGAVNDNGVLRGIPREIPLSVHFMAAADDERYAPTEQAFTLEPFVTKEMFEAPNGLQLRADAQIVQIRKMLDLCWNRPAPQPQRMLKAA